MLCYRTLIISGVAKGGQGGFFPPVKNLPSYQRKNGKEEENRRKWAIFSIGSKQMCQNRWVFEGVTLLGGKGACAPGKKMLVTPLLIFRTLYVMTLIFSAFFVQLEFHLQSWSYCQKMTTK